MEISLYADYSFRVLMYLALHRTKLVQIKTISDAYHVSENHLVKVVQHLVRLGYVASVRGRNGGIRLAKDPLEISVGEVFRKTEPNLRLVPCLDRQQKACPITSVCELKAIFNNALQSFMNTLDQKTIADLVSQKEMMTSVLRLKPCVGD